jgi:hypothetical protein
MTIDLTVLNAGALLVLMALIWKVNRDIGERLREIQADIGELHKGVSHLFLLASKPGRKTVSDRVAHRADERSQSPGLEADLAVVDGLCAKLIALVRQLRQAL